jgi:hypothetical protein
MNKNQIKKLRTFSCARNNQALLAAILYVLRRDRDEHPTGHFDNARRWYASGRDKEVLAWCRQPSRAYPWSEMRSCCSLRHCCRYYDIQNDQDYICAKRFVSALDHLLKDRPLPKTAATQLSLIKALLMVQDTKPSGTNF